MKLAGYIAGNTAGGGFNPVLCTLAKREQDARAFLCSCMERTGQGRQPWNWWARNGYAVRPAVLEVPDAAE